MQRQDVIEALNLHLLGRQIRTTVFRNGYPAPQLFGGFVVDVKSSRPPTDDADALDDAHALLAAVLEQKHLERSERHFQSVSGEGD